MTFPICPCDGADIKAPVNPPALPRIAYRVGTYADFRRAVLAPTQPDALSAGGTPPWRTDGAGDLAVMIAEWFAYIADILTFYNERIANQDYLRTADLPESVAHLIALLGYRPRPAIGATGKLAALVTAGQSAILPKGLQFQSKPAPGQPPQTFELAQATQIGPPDQIPAIPPPQLLAPADSNSVGPNGGGTYSLRLAGAVDSIEAGALLALFRRDIPTDDPNYEPLLATVKTATIVPTAAGGKETRLTVTLPEAPPPDLTAAKARLMRASQSVPLWGFSKSAVDFNEGVHLASLVRQIRPDDWVLVTPPGDDAELAQVLATKETILNAVPGPGGSVPILHTVLTLDAAVASKWGGETTVHFGWTSVGTLLDQPFGPWSGTPTT